MATSAQEFVGFEAYSREGEKIGKVKDVICDPDSDADECLVIKYGLFRDLVVPADVVQTAGRVHHAPLHALVSRHGPSRRDQREAVED